MKIIHLPESAQFSRTAPHRQVLHDAAGLRIMTLNFEPGQEMPVHSHYADAQVAFLVLEGEGIFTGEELDFPIQTGVLQVMPAGEPHGFKATTRLRLLVFIAPPF